MKTPIVLEAKTNSDQPTPAYAQFDQAQLDGFIAEFSTAVDWSKPQINSLNVEVSPDVYFVDDADGVDEWEDDENASRWEQTLVTISQDSAMILFAHTETGDELFFEYQQIQS